MAELVEKLEALRPLITQHLAVSGAPAISLGVLHQGEVIHTAHFGRKDSSVEDSLPDDDTVYRVASLTKALTVGVVASLVEDGTLRWDTPIRDYLPAFRQRQDVIGQQATLVDVLSNRSGLGIANLFWGQQHGTFLLPDKAECVRMACFVDAVKPFRRAFVYTNWGYGLATAVVEQVTGRSFGAVARERLFDPLGMARTTLADTDALENLAYVHAVRNDGTSVRMPFSNYSDKTGLAGGAAGKSSIRDLLVAYKSMLAAFTHQTRTGATSTPGSPFAQLKTMFAPHIPANSKTPIDDVAYCLGLYRTRLPGNLGIASLNAVYLGAAAMPVLGAGCPGLEVWHHTGNLPGMQASAFLVPASESAVVVLTNAMPLSDPTDFVAQQALAVLLGDQQQAPRDTVKLAARARQRSLGSYAVLARSLEAGRTATPPRHPLAAYEGQYVNNAGNFVLGVEARRKGEGWGGGGGGGDKEQGDEGGLLLRVQGMAEVYYPLRPYDGETFYWPADREWELCEKRMFPFPYVDWHKISFRTAEEDGTVSQLVWKHDPLAKAEVFTRMDDRQRGKMIKL